MRPNPKSRGGELAVRMKRAAEMLSISKDQLWRMTRDNKIPHKRVSPGMVLYPVDELRAWLKDLHSNGTSTDLQDAA